MKRLLSVLLAAMLVLSAATALADVTFTTPYYTMTLPDGWEIDQEDLEADSGEGMEALGYCYASEEIGMVIEAFLLTYEDLQDFSLWKADAAGVQDYVDAVMEDFADDKPEFLGIVQAGSIPFVLIRGADEYGDYLYADTMTNGYAIEFMAYVTDAEGEIQYPLSDDAIETFKSILVTFLPAA